VVRNVPSLSLMASTGSASEARSALRGKPDVLLVDLGLPDGSGVDVIREAQRVSPGTRAMVITVFVDERHVMDAIAAGAMGYLLKDGSAEYVGRLAKGLDIGLHGLEPRLRHAVAQASNGVANAPARVVKWPLAGAGCDAATAATGFFARHLAFGPGDDVVELAAHGIEACGDDSARIACVFLQSGEAGARRFLAGNQAPPESVAESDRPDGEEHVERKRHEAFAKPALGAERFA
jgi:CheY-like chemotaxis protein